MATPTPTPDPWTTWLVSGGAAAAIVALLKALDAVWGRLRGGEQDHWKNAGELRKEWKEAAEEWKKEARELAAELDAARAERDAARVERDESRDVAAELREKNKGLAAKLGRYKDTIHALGGEVSEVDTAEDTAELVITPETAAKLEGG